MQETRCNGKGEREKIREIRYKMQETRRENKNSYNLPLIPCILSFSSCLLYLVSCILSLASCFFLINCAQNRRMEPMSVVYYREKQLDPFQLAIRFAPRLYINSKEPYDIKDLIVFIHPEKPFIAYHLLWEDDSIGAGIGMESDHEIAWVEYDPISLKLVNNWALWHRGILHTQESVIEAKRNDQRPSFCVQWGQHGMLPFGWEKLPKARPDPELRIHFAISKLIQVGPYKGSKNISTLKFQGEFEDYIKFDVLVIPGNTFTPIELLWKLIVTNLYLNWFHILLCLNSHGHIRY
jgi:hypothetical protein